jgi:23S rRNA pseudouridine2605 synthase
VPSEKPRGLRKPQRPPRRQPAASPAAVPSAGTHEIAERPARAARGTRGQTPVESQKLQKILAQAGLGSRRAMELWIEAGRVTVNGKAAGIGTRVMPADRIAVDGRELRLAHAAEAPRVLMYHKPEGEIVTRDDPQGRETVFARLPRLRGARWLSIGRLDVSTSGLLLFTTSGALANSMMHPRFAVEREYAARVFGRLSEEQAAQLLAGVELEDGVARCDKLQDEGGEGANHWYRLVMSEGRNRVVRRLFEAVGLTVSRLIRVRFGPLQLPPRLKRGQLEELPPADVRRLSEWLAQPVPAAHAATAVKTAKAPRGPRAANPRAST